MIVRLIASILIALPFYGFNQSNGIVSLTELNNQVDELLSVNFDSACALAFKGKEIYIRSTDYDKAVNQLYCGTCYRSYNQDDSAYIVLTEARDYFEGTDNVKDLGTANWYIAKIWMNVQKSDRAREFYERAIENFDDAGNIQGKLRVLNEVGVSYGIQGDWDKCLSYFLQALEIIENSEFRDDKYRILQNISVVYKTMKDYERALFYNQQVFALTDTMSNRDLIIDALTQRAFLHSSIGQKDSSEYFIGQAIEWSTKTNRKAYVHKSLANYYESIGNDQEAIKYLRSILKNNYSPMNRDNHLIDLSIHYKNIQRLDSALYFINEAYDYSIKNGLKQSIARSSEELARYHAQNKDYKSAYEYVSQALIYRDSILTEDNKSEITNLTIRLETREKINEIEQLKLRAELTQSENRLLLITACMLSVILILSYFYFQSKVKLQQVRASSLQIELDSQQRSLQTQALSMIRLKNQLEEIRSYLKSVKPKFKEKASEIQKVINMINVNKSLEKEWEGFNQSFEQIHTSFYDQLKQSFPQLTVNEMRMAALIKMNMTNSEISSLLNIESSSVRMSKYRLKKKLNLGDSEDLNEFIGKFGGKNGAI